MVGLDRPAQVSEYETGAYDGSDELRHQSLSGAKLTVRIISSGILT
jgi:hypothetical protein